MMPVSVRLNHAIADGFLVANVYRLLEQEMTQALKGAAFRYKTAWEHAVFKSETRGNSCVFYIFALLQESPVWAWYKERG